MPSISKYSHIIDEYKSYLRSDVEHRLCFSFFCRCYGIKANNVIKWMRRRGLSVSSLDYEIMLEKYASSPSVPSHGHTFKRACTLDVSSDKLSKTLLLKGVNITFSDGVVVSIRQATAPALTKFIDSYNQLCDKRHVQP